MKTDQIGSHILISSPKIGSRLIAHSVWFIVGIGFAAFLFLATCNGGPLS